MIGQSKTPLHFTCSKSSKKLFIAQVEQVQNERHAKFGAKAVSVDLLGSDSEKILVLAKSVLVSIVVLP